MGDKKMAFHPDGSYLAVGSWWCRTDRVPIHLWEVTTSEHLHTFWGHASDIQNHAFSPDGMLLASGSFDGSILLWNMKPFFYREETAKYGYLSIHNNFLAVLDKIC